MGIIGVAFIVYIKRRAADDLYPLALSEHRCAHRGDEASESSTSLYSTNNVITTFRVVNDPLDGASTTSIPHAGQINCRQLQFTISWLDQSKYIGAT